MKKRLILSPRVRAVNLVKFATDGTRSLRSVLFDPWFLAAEGVDEAPGRSGSSGVPEPSAAAASLPSGTLPGESPPSRTVYSVSDLNREVRTLLESGIGHIWVQGELSNLSRPSSGHWYFSLKDRGAQLRCAMFRTRNLLSRLTPREGQQVLARGRVSLYSPRGS